MVLKIAWRSIARNRRRTVVTTGAMAVACAVMVFFVALMDGYMASMETNALKMELGRLQIHAPGYRKDPDLYKRIGAPDEIVEGLGRRGYSAAGRLYGFALAASRLIPSSRASSRAGLVRFRATSRSVFWTSCSGSAGMA